MTITVLPSRNEYTATAGQTVFTYTFKIFEDTDIDVYVTPAGQSPNDATDIVTPSSVTGVGSAAGGTVTISATSAGDLVTIVSDIPTSRTTDYQNNGDFRPDTVNDDFDRAYSIAKQTEDTANRTLSFEKSVQNASSKTLPAPEAGRLVRWNSGGTGLENVDIATPVETSIESIAALRNLDVTGFADGTTIQVTGYYTKGDGGGGPTRYLAKGQPPGTYVDNGGSIIVPTGGDGSSAWLWGERATIKAEEFGLVGDNSTDNTTQSRILLNLGVSIIFKPTGVYLTDYISVSDIDDIVIYGNGATLKRLATSAGADYMRGAILAFGGCNNIAVRDLAFDGNRLNLISTTPLNVSMNYGIGLYGSSTIGSDVLLDSGGEDKGSKNITIENCKFYRTGSNSATIDKFGDGVFAFGIDGLIIQNCYFEDMGRWAVAAGDSFNITIDNNIVKNATAGTLATALGSFDIENESSDQTNGSYSRGIKITNNKCYGRSSIYNVARASAANENGAYHYIKDIEIRNNYVETYYVSSYCESNLYVFMTREGTTYPEYSDAIIENNVFKSTAATPLTYNVLIQPEVSQIPTSNVSVSKNICKGSTNGIWTDSTQMPVLTDYRINGNSVIAEHASAGRGIYCEADQHINVSICNNYVKDYGLEGIVAIRNTSGAGLVRVNDNDIYEGLATFTGNAIRVSSDTVRAKDNFVDVTSGTDYDLSASVKLISNARIEDQMVEGSLTLSGATGTFTNAIPAGATVVGVSTRVTTAITGATTFDIGIATDVDRYGAARNIALNSTTSNNNWTITSPVMYPATQSIILTANGGNFTAGVVKIVIHYTFVTAPFTE